MSTDKAAKKSSSERRDLYIVHQHCPDRPYLELEVPEDFLKPRFIEFEVDSRDQGKSQVSSVVAPPGIQR